MSLIGELGSELSRIEETKRVKRKNEIAVNEIVPSKKSENVLELSANGTDLDKITQEIKSLPEIEPDRVEHIKALKEKIKNGTYTIDEEKIKVIAQKLIESDELSLGLFN